MLSVAWGLQLLQAVPKVVAAAPKFKQLFDQFVGTFKSGTDQATLQQAYDLALSDAADANQDLADLVASHS